MLIKCLRWIDFIFVLIPSSKTSYFVLYRHPVRVALWVVSNLNVIIQSLEEFWYFLNQYFFTIPYRTIKQMVEADKYLEPLVLSEPFLRSHKGIIFYFLISESKRKRLGSIEIISLYK